MAYFWIKHRSFPNSVQLGSSSQHDTTPPGCLGHRTQGMDPHQRVVLEVGYEACHHAGYSKGKLMNKIGPSLRCTTWSGQIGQNAGDIR